MDGSLLVAAAAIAMGGVIGTLQGALGAGGAILTIPALVHGLGVPLDVATITSLFVTCANAGVGSLHALRAGRALPRTGIALGGIGVAGTFVGAWLHRGVDETVVLALFSLVMLAAAALMASQRTGADDTGLTSERVDLRRAARLVAVGSAVGLLTGFFGVGGGFLLVPALVAALGVPMRLAPGTSMVAIALNSTWGLAAHAHGVAADATIAILFGGAGVIGVTIGGRVARHVPDARLRQAFAGLVAGLAVFTFARDVPALAALLTRAA